ncbi:hypothetical protein ACH5RR_006043 [Cinchona calisaya]|uniref:RNA-dependent RNA polymerase n=1 Tax=Cinchona calisaya TaxID=153742 RepID=A0ABD3AMY6_9GENT
MGDYYPPPPLPQTVEDLLLRICEEKEQLPPDNFARLKLAEIGEEKALEVVQRIYYSRQPIRTDLSRYITWFCCSPRSPTRQQQTSPTSSPTPSPLSQSFSPLRRALLSPSSIHSTNIAGPSTAGHPSSFSSEPENADSTSPREISYQLGVLSRGLEFRKFFLLCSYIGRNKLEDVITPEVADNIVKMKDFPMSVYESHIWDTYGQQICDPSDRRESIDWESGKTHLYHCHVYQDGSYSFKGPYLNTTRTHLQRTVGDDNVLIVKFVEEGRYCTNGIFKDGILVGLRRYRFFVFKESKVAKRTKKGAEKNKTSVSASVKCYFVRFDSIAPSGDDEPYILSSLEVNEARKLFMHVHKVSSMAKYIARFSLILSTTIRLPVDLSSVVIERIQDIQCRDENDKIIYDEDGEALILTDGTGFISEDLALKCPQYFGRAKYITKDKDFQKFRSFIGCEDVPLEGRGSAAQNRDPPLLMQCRLFSKGHAVKGTLLLNKKLKAGTIQIRSSMVKVERDVTATVQTFDSLEIVAVSRRPRRCNLSRYLIALLSYGGVPKTFFLDLLTSVLEETEAIFTDKRAAFKVAVNNEECDDAGSAIRMMLAGIPLTEPHLQKRLSELANTERSLLMEGKLPITESFYVMGTADPTAKRLLNPNEVCVILDNGQISGEVLVYRNPGLHFGDIHVLQAVYVKELEDIIGNAKYGIFFSAKGQRSVASEIANGDFDGDMYWVSRNPELLKYFRATQPWTRVYSSPHAEQKKPNEFSDEELEHELFELFLETRKPSFSMSTAADSWLAFMDRLLTLGDGCADEKDALRDKILRLIDIYYDALDAPKSGKKVNVPEDLEAERFPHYMGKQTSYHSTSILGDIHDRIQVFQSEEQCKGEIWKLPCFDTELPQKYLSLWNKRYNDYRKEMTEALKKDDESKNAAANEVIKKYKQLLYGAAEFEESQKHVQEIYNEALAIYHVTYDYAISQVDAGKCGFAWRVAGSALLNLYALSRNEKLIPVSPSALREIFS